MDQVVKYDVTDAALEQLREEFTEVPDVTTKDGYEVVRLGLAKIRTLRVSVEKRRKELKAEALAHGRKVDGEAGRITGVLEAIEGPMKGAKVAIDCQREEERLAKLCAENKRKGAIQARITEIRSVPLDYTDSSSKEINEAFDILVTLDTENDGFEEYAEEATTAKGEVLETLAILQAKAMDREKEDERRKEEERKLAEEREAFEKEQAKAEEKRLEDERVAEAERKEKQDKIDADNKERQDAIDADNKKAQDKLDADREELRLQQEEIDRKEQEEADRIAKEKEDQRLIDEKKLADEELKKKEKEDKALQEAKYQETYDALSAICSEPLPVGKILDAIQAGEIPNVIYEV